MKATIPENITPLDWLASMCLLIARGYSADEAQEIVVEAAEKMEAMGEWAWYQRAF